MVCKSSTKVVRKFTHGHGPHSVVPIPTHDGLSDAHGHGPHSVVQQRPVSGQLSPTACRPVHQSLTLSSVMRLSQTARCFCMRATLFAWLMQHTRKPRLPCRRATGRRHIRPGDAYGATRRYQSGGRLRHHRPPAAGATDVAAGGITAAAIRMAHPEMRYRRMGRTGAHVSSGHRHAPPPASGGREYRTGVQHRHGTARHGAHGAGCLSACPGRIGIAEMGGLCRPGVIPRGGGTSGRWTAAVLAGPHAAGLCARGSAPFLHHGARKDDGRPLWPAGCPNP